MHFRAQANGGVSGHHSSDASFTTSPSLKDTPNQQEPLPNTGNIDFITFGRSDFPDISIGTLLSDRDAYAHHRALMNANSIQAREKGPNDISSTIPPGISPAARAVEVFHNQSLLPTKEQIFNMVDYHERNMLYWSGGVYHGPSFRRSLVEAYGQAEELQLAGLDWKWAALLFSILSSSHVL